MKKNYILTFDKGNWLESSAYKQLHERLTSDAKILNWCHYLETSYIIVTDFRTPPQYLSELFREIIQNKFVFVCELNLQNCNGWLPQEAWEWVNKTKNPPFNNWHGTL